MTRPTAIDLFAGCGGFSLGLEAAGFEVIAAVELDPIHALIHHCNFPACETVCQDLRLLHSNVLADIVRQKSHGDLDLLAGGPPCQGFSFIGKRQLDDPRNSLVFQYQRIVADLRPKYFILENVPGMAAGKHQKIFQDLQDRFTEIGYRLTLPIQTLDSSLYGAPQKRKRLILLGSRKDMMPLNYPEATSYSPVTVADAIADLAEVEAFIGKDQGIDSSKLDYSGFRSSFFSYPQGFYHLCHARVTDGSIYNHVASQHTPQSRERFQGTTPGTVEKTSRLLRLSSDKTCNTLRAGTTRDKGAFTAPRPIHYQHPRCITVREAARLHTFPDWFHFHSTIWHGFREIGNAVIPLLAKALGDEVIQALGIDITQIVTRQLDAIDFTYLSYNLSSASRYWHISPDIIPKRDRKKRDCAVEDSR